MPGQPAQKNVIFAPRLTDRDYVVKSKADLNAVTRDTLTSSTFSDSARKFYHVEITKP